MRHLKDCRLTLIKLKWQENLNFRSRAQQLRGAIARMFPGDSLFHQHEGDNFLYRYPLIQYRWEKNLGIVLGIDEGADRIIKIPWVDCSFQLINERVTVTDAEIICSKDSFGISERLEKYTFLSPWLPFNQENYKPYQIMNPVQQRLERDRLLVAQILSALRGLKIDFPERLYATFEIEKTVTVNYKEQNLTGLLGNFYTNAALPKNFAIGRAVSNGYGWFNSYEHSLTVER